MKRYIVSALALMMCASCNKWFDVTASSEIRREDHYKSVQGYQQTLVGCYIGMSESPLYGKTLSWYALEMLAHQYETSNDPDLSEIFAYNYKSKRWLSAISDTWAKAYNVIVNANDALASLETNKGKLHPVDYAVLRGELLGVRAWLHFDLLRLYGYGNWSQRTAELNAKLTIPYVTGVSKNLAPQQTGADLYKLLMQDIEASLELLRDNDPLTKKKPVSDYAQLNADGFYNYRNLHLNYYAMRALEARVHQWFGTSESMSKALAAAQEVIAFVEGGGAVDLLKTNIGLISARGLYSGNYSLTQEALFALNVNKLDDLVRSYIIPDFASGNVLAFHIAPARVESMYEGQNLDVRFSRLLHQNLLSANRGYVSIKYLQRDLDLSNKDRINLVRIPELYYIAAEAHLATKGAGGISDAITLLNKMRTQRGISTPLESSSLDLEKTREEIKKEYIKEFVSEGVLFYMYKRLGSLSVPNLPAGVTMGDAQYVWPYPDFELQSGRKQ